MSLEKKDLELIESLIYKNGDDIAVSIARSFERLEKHGDDAESRIYSRLSDIEDRLELSRQDLSDIIDGLEDKLRDILRFKADMVGA